MLAIAQLISGLSRANTLTLIFPNSLSEIYRPDTSPCAEVEYTLRILINRGEVELSIKKYTVYVMNEVHTLLLIFIVGLRDMIE
jgi:hypothetical protein